MLVSPVARFLNVIASFSSSSNGFLILVTNFTMQVVYAIIDEVNKGNLHPDKILVPWDVGVLMLARRLL